MQQQNLQRGDIVWLRLPQSLAPLHVAQQQPEKTRPFIVLAPATIAVDHNYRATQDRPIFGMDCTSQDFLVEGRPHLEFHMHGHSNKTTYALLDSVRDIGSMDQNLRVNDWLEGEDFDDLNEGLSNVLRPEQRFYLSTFFNSKRGVLPGGIHRIKTINADGEALVLLKRGKFICSDNVENSSDIDLSTQKARHTPYLVAYFKKATGVTTLRGITWNDIQIMAVQERDIHESVGKIETQSMANVLNLLRKRSGLQPIQYKTPIFKHFASFAPLARLRITPG